MSEELATLLATLRRERRQQSGLRADLVPADAAAAYRVAARVAEQLGWSIGGWKIAAMKEELQRELRASAPMYGRVYRQFILQGPVTLNHAELLRPIPEVEYAVVLGADLPPRDKPYSQDEVADAVASIHPGLEVAECRFVHDAQFPPQTAILADGSGAGSIVMGPAIANWRERDLAGQEVVLRVNGVERRRGTAGAAIDHPLVPVTWLANELSRNGIGMCAGEVISSGTLTGMLLARAGDEHVADYGAFGSVVVKFA